MKHCLICNGKFTPSRVTQIYCTRSCQKIREKEQSREWYRANYEHARRNAARWGELNPTRRKETRVAWNSRNVEKMREHKNTYRKRNLDKYAIAESARRAIKRKVEGSFSLDEWRYIREMFDNCCAYCGHRTALSQDHVVPLRRPDSSPTHSSANILPACKTCNSSKNARLVQEWRPELVEPLAQLFEEWNFDLAKAIRKTVEHV